MLVGTFELENVILRKIDCVNHTRYVKHDVIPFLICFHCILKIDR